MKRLVILLAVAPLLLAAECQRPPSPPPPTPGGSGGADAFGGAPPASGGASFAGSSSGGATQLSACERACMHLAALGCKAAKPTDAGVECAQVCEDVNASGTLRVDTDCVEHAGDCATADRCVR